MLINIHLIVPSLFWPNVSQTEIYRDLSMPALETLLAKSIANEHPPQEMEIWLCNAFKVTQQQNNWPIAPIMLHIDAPEKIKTINRDYWIRADPVHLRIEQNHIMLADSGAFEISEDEAEQITQYLNQNLKCYPDFKLLPLQPYRWYIRLPRTIEIQTYTIGQVTCKNINNFLPAGKESMIWRKIINEIQMLLHEHPVNQARESCEKLPINSLWLWGGGTLPQSIQSPYTHVWSRNNLPQALALASNARYSNLPTHADKWLQNTISGNHLIVLDMLSEKAKYRKALDWRENLSTLENNWFSPLHNALKKGEINQLTITSIGETSLQNFVIRRSNLWKFWLLTRPLMFYAR